MVPLYAISLFIIISSDLKKEKYSKRIWNSFWISLSLFDIITFCCIFKILFLVPHQKIETKRVNYTSDVSKILRFAIIETKVLS